MKRRVQRHDVIQPLDPSYKLIPLTQGQNALVDTADFEWLSRWDWFADFDAKQSMWYAKKRGIRMHRFIVDAQKGGDVDHKNLNGLDNRRENLRRCTRVQNMQNSGLRKDSTSGFKGVTWYPHHDANKWVASITVNKKRMALGYFDTAEQAARAYDNVAREHFGEFAQLNFPTAFHSVHLIKRFSLVL